MFWVDIIFIPWITIINYLLFSIFRSIQKSDLEKYITSYYKPGRMVLAAAGGVDHDALVNLAKQHFSAQPKYEIDIPDVTSCRFTGNVSLNFT